MSIEVGECLELEADLERYACYERLSEAALSEKAAAEGAALSTPNVVASPEGWDADKPVAEQPAPKEVRSSIRALDERRPNEFLITLENDQVWRQSIAKRYPLRVGEEVRIYPTRWGSSFRLSAMAANGFIQVERIR